MSLRKMRMRVIDRLTLIAVHTVAVSVAMTAGVISNTLSLVDDVLDQPSKSKKPFQDKK
ncbi:hypothetical protein M3P05_04330 [Sansalvadorimonas sp. 2012CJ34-2]|uniref:Uncharacterized protein n=1 Tax=Parendozoicomonas callyspongiae TaxID=2942213 RepID=A0ABT0PCW4_9GAMM|nr:hypothetical protein [Sansalvadorimonas sp. 2012CJ34-2]MCL6269170.1 hypothetical protein [Sansalvadorimonas sp. 2012CJ34-2]